MALRIRRVSISASASPSDARNASSTLIGVNIRSILCAAFATASSSATLFPQVGPARSRPSDFPSSRSATAPRSQSTFPTSLRATSARDCSARPDRAEPHVGHSRGPNGRPRVGGSASSHASNDRVRTNKDVKSQIADALRLVSCRTSMPAMAWTRPAVPKQSLQRAWAAPLYSIRPPPKLPALRTVETLKVQKSLTKMGSGHDGREITSGPSSCF